MRQTIAQVVLAGCLIVLFNACLQDIDDVQLTDWSPEIAIPITNTTYSIQDFLENNNSGGSITTDEDNLLKLIHAGRVSSLNGADKIQIPDVSIPLPNSSLDLSSSMIPFGYDLTKVDFKGGELRFAFDNIHNEDLMVSLQINELMDNGMSITYNIPVSWDGSASQTIMFSTDLMDKTLDLSGGNLSISYDARLSSTNQSVLLDKASIGLKDISYRYIQGYIGNISFDLPLDSIAIDLFENSVGSSIYFEDPIIRTSISNSFGVPVRIQANALNAMTHESGIMAITSDLDDGVDFNYPTLSEVGDYASTMIEFNASNTNIATIISDNPYLLLYDFSATANPENDPNIEGFLMDDSRFSVDFELELPLWLRSDIFTLENVVEFDGSILDEIEAAHFKLNTNNGLPIDADLQFFFEDENGVVLGTLFDTPTPILSSGELDADGRVISNGSNELDIPLSNSLLQQIMPAKQIRIAASIVTADMGTTSVKFYSDYAFNFQMGLKATLKNPN